MEDLNDILNPPQQEEVASEVGEEQEQEQQQEETGVAESQVAAETHQEVKEEKQEDPAAIRAAIRAELEAEKAAEMAAIAKERERVRTKAAELEAKLAQKPEEKRPDFWEDPEARLAAERQQFEQVLHKQRLDFSEMLARQAHGDFQEKLDTFVGLVHENPALWEQMSKQQNPAEWAYEQASKHMRMKQLEEIGDPQEYENKLRERIKAELAAEQEAAEAARKAAAVEETIARKLKNAGFAELRSVGSPSTKKQTFDGPPSLEAILKT